MSGCQVHLYADDTILYCIADSVQLAIEDLQLCLMQIKPSKISLFYRNRSSFPVISRKRIIEAVLDYGDVIYSNSAPSTLDTRHGLSFFPQIYYC